MSKKVYFNQKAEKEAVDIGKKFMNSADVVGDMSRAYGTDLSSVRLHTDDGAARKTAERGVDAFSTGKDVFFGKDVFKRDDPASRGLLAHELSHSLQQGVGGGESMTQSAPMGAEQGGLIEWFRSLFKKRPNVEDTLLFGGAQEALPQQQIAKHFREHNSKGSTPAPGRENLSAALRTSLADTSQYGTTLDSNFANASNSVVLKGFNASRSVGGFAGPVGGDATTEEIVAMYQDLRAGERYNTLGRQKARTEAEQVEMDAYTPEQVRALDARFDRGAMKVKSLQLGQLRRLREKYGTYGTQMHPEDFLARVGPEFFEDMGFLQDTEQMLVSGSKYFDLEHNAEDQEYKLLSNYFNDMYSSLSSYTGMDTNPEGDTFTPSNFGMEIFNSMPENGRARALEARMAESGAVGFSEKEQKGYNRRLKSRFKKGGMLNRLFGRFL